VHRNVATLVDTPAGQEGRLLKFPQFPVTVTHLPITRCQICRRNGAHRQGSPSEVPTEHYRRLRPEALGLQSR